MNNRKDNAVIGFWLLFKESPVIQSKDTNFYQFDLAEPNENYFYMIREACANLISNNTNIFILIDNVIDEYLLNAIRYKLYQYKIPYTKLINSKEGLDPENSLQMVIDPDNKNPEFVRIDLV